MTYPNATMDPPKVSVLTSNHGGHSPETIAELCVDKLIQVSDSAPPEIALQAKAFRQQILEVVLQYVRVAAREDRATVVAHLGRAGMPDIAQQIRRL